MSEPVVKWQRHPVDYPVSFPFGATSDPYSPWNPHRGSDYACPEGTPIYAMHDGILHEHGAHPDSSKPWGWSMDDGYGDGSTGNMIVIDGGDGWPSSVFHLSRFWRDWFGNGKNGSFVRAGEIVGYVGTTGASSGPHAHGQRDCRGALTNLIADCRDPLLYMEDAPMRPEERKIFVASGRDTIQETYRKLVAGGILPEEGIPDAATLPQPGPMPEKITTLDDAIKAIGSLSAELDILNNYLVKRFRMEEIFESDAKVNAAAALI